MVFDVNVHDVMVPVDSSGFKVLFQGSVRAVTRHGEEHVVDAIGWHRLKTHFVTKVATQCVIASVVALQQAIGDEQQRVRRAAAIVAVEDLAGGGDRGFAKLLVTFSFTF
ncbi:Uncharacterised protein [Enterobacter cloacae]|nr:Uncharacterised protein [Enterobacter cloacae]